VRDGQSQVPTGRETADGHKLRIGAKFVFSMLVKISDNIVYVIMGSRERVNGSKAVGWAYDNSACSSRRHLCKHRIVLWNSTHEASTVNINV